MMSLGAGISKQIRGVFFGGNWTDSNFKDQLADVSLQEAYAGADEANTIAQLTYHISYFVKVQVRVMEGGPLKGSDSESFDVPAYTKEEEWRSFIEEVLKLAARHASLVSQLEDEVFSQPFIDQKYGSWWDNLIGLVEHTHYHLGQIVLLKKVSRKP